MVLDAASRSDRRHADFSTPRLSSSPAPVVSQSCFSLAYFCRRPDAASAAFEVGYESASQFNRNTAASLDSRRCATSMRAAYGQRDSARLRCVHRFEARRISVCRGPGVRVVPPPPDPGWKFLIGMELQAKVWRKILSGKGLATDSSQERTYEQFFAEGKGCCGCGASVHVSILPEDGGINCNLLWDGLRVRARGKVFRSGFRTVRPWEGTWAETVGGIRQSVTSGLRVNQPYPKTGSGPVR